MTEANTSEEDDYEPMDVTSASIVKVAEEHVRQFNNKISIGEDETNTRSRNINLRECHRYRAIWQSIINKNGKDLNPTELGEVQDAFYDGGYDNLFERVP